MAARSAGRASDAKSAGEMEGGRDGRTSPSSGRSEALTRQLAGCHVTSSSRAPACERQGIGEEEGGGKGVSQRRPICVSPCRCLWPGMCTYLLLHQPDGALDVVHHARQHPAPTSSKAQGKRAVSAAACLRSIHHLSSSSHQSAGMRSRKRQAVAASSPVTRHSSSLTLWPGATDARYHEYRHEYDRRFSSRPAASSRLMLPTESARLLHSHTQTETARP